MKIIKKIYALLTPSECKRAHMLIAMILVMAFLDAMGVASILPFIAVLTNTELVQTNTLLNMAFNFGSHFGIHTIDQFLFALGVSVFLLLVISLAFRALTTYAQTRFALMREYSIGKRLVESYLHQPYSWFLNHNSTNLGKNILSEVNTVIEYGLLPLTTLISQSVVALALIILLIVIDPMLALSVGLVFSLAYISIFTIVSGWLNRLGHKRAQANEERFNIVSEAFGAVKEIKVGALEQAYIKLFVKPAQVFAQSQATARVLGLLPRYVLEAIAFGGLLLLILYYLYKNISFVSAIPVLALYAFTGYRLMPALQKIYQAFTLLRFVGPALDSLHEDISRLQIVNDEKHEKIPLLLTKSIKLQQASYTYPDSLHPAIKDIDLNISARSKVGFIGITGSGKTTAVNLILGLLEPQEGNLKIDGQLITSANRKQWLRSIGYVPQNIYLADNSVTANIAFGINSKDIDQQAVEHASKIANLHEFVVKDLPQGYATIVGERGVRLSGGQRQRIGIARALYHKPQLLILDEGTSALDNLTQEIVMGSLNNLGYDITVIIVAHRLSTVRQCNQIFLLDKGKVKSKGTFEQLATTSDQFKEMLKIN